MWELETRGEGIVASVKAQPGARKTELRGYHDGALRVAITEVAEKGKANQALIAFLARLLDIPKSDIQLVSGAASTRKRLLIRGLTAQEIRERLDE